MEKLKKMAGVTAAQYVKDGMVVGLGTGSTAYFFEMSWLTGTELNRGSA